MRLLRIWIFKNYQILLGIKSTILKIILFATSLFKALVVLRSIIEAEVSAHIPTFI
jgi:hypothetical protein